MLPKELWGILEGVRKDFEEVWSGVRWFGEGLKKRGFVVDQMLSGCDCNSDLDNLIHFI